MRVLRYWRKNKYWLRGTVGDTWNCYFCKKLHNTNKKKPVEAKNEDEAYVMSCINCFNKKYRRWKCSKCKKWFKEEIYGCCEDCEEACILKKYDDLQILKDSITEEEKLKYTGEFKTIYPAFNKLLNKRMATFKTLQQFEELENLRDKVSNIHNKIKKITSYSHIGYRIWYKIYFNYPEDVKSIFNTTPTDDTLYYTNDIITSYTAYGKMAEINEEDELDDEDDRYFVFELLVEELKKINNLIQCQIKKANEMLLKKPN